MMLFYALYGFNPSFDPTILPHTYVRILTKCIPETASQGTRHDITEAFDARMLSKKLETGFIETQSRV
jgi:hypothetical protein